MQLATIPIVAIASCVLLAGAAPPKRPTACELISKAEVEALFGPVVGEPDYQPFTLCAGWGGLCAGTDGSICKFQLVLGDRVETRDGPPFVEVRVTYAPFEPGDWATMERERLSGDSSRGVDLRDVQGLGDVAYWYLDQKYRWNFLSIYTTDTHLYIFVAGVADQAAVVRGGMAIAKTAVARLH